MKKSIISLAIATAIASIATNSLASMITTLMYGNSGALVFSG